MTSSILLKPSKNQITSSHILNNYRYRCDIYLNKFMEKNAILLRAIWGFSVPLCLISDEDRKWRIKALLQIPNKRSITRESFKWSAFVVYLKKLHTGKKWTGLTNRNENYDKTGDRENFYSLSLLKIS